MNEEGNVVEENEVDELDTWFDEIEDDEDQSAEEITEETESSSDDVSEEEPVPDDEVQQSDAVEAASDDGTETSAKTSEADDQYYWMSGLDPESRKHVEAVIHSDRSNRGRVAALQRQLDEERAEKEARANTPAVRAGNAPAQADSNKEDMSDEELEAFMEEYPTVARNVQKLVEQRVAREREEIMGQVRPMQEAALKERLAAKKAELRKEAEYIFNSEQTGIYLDDVLNSNAFRDWMAEQPVEYREFARSAQSVDAASKVLTDFAMYADRQIESMYPSPEEEPKEQQTPSRADQTAARRQQARQGTSVPSRTAQLDDAGLGDYEAIFNSLVDAG